MLFFTLPSLAGDAPMAHRARFYFLSTWLNVDGERSSGDARASLVRLPIRERADHHDPEDNPLPHVAFPPPPLGTLLP